jgi:hypothetical protein
MKTFPWLGLALLLWGSLTRLQAEKLPPPFSGTWVLNMQRSKVEAAHPPASGEAVIRYDGKTWHFKRTHRNDAGKADVWSIDLVVGSPKFHVEKDGPYVFRSQMFRDGDSLVLTENITSEAQFALIVRTMILQWIWRASSASGTTHLTRSRRNLLAIG